MGNTVGRVFLIFDFFEIPSVQPGLGFHLVRNQSPIFFKFFQGRLEVPLGVLSLQKIVFFEKKIKT